VRDAIGDGLVTAAQDVSGGGLGVALAEMAIWSGLGAELRLPISSSPAADLFGESPSRIVVTSRPERAEALLTRAVERQLPATALGLVGRDRLVVELAGAGATGAAEERGSRVADSVDVAVADLEHAWQDGLPRALGWAEARA
ncbi:MAG TPA: AIR synthase-related protein, partial [Candidatus Limnocylindrales bacterium]|nr:AIR synthase-related protein [Candidatus Limnocylindrales bacterium]